MTDPAPAKKRVLMVTEYFHPHWTGLAKGFMNIAVSLLERGHPVRVLTSQFSEDLARHEQVSGVEVHRSPCLFRISRTHYSAKMLVDFVRLAREADAVIINSPFSNIFFIAALARCMGKKIFIFHQGDLILPRHTSSGFSNFIIERVFDSLTFPALFLADVVSTYTEDYADHSRMLRHFKKKFRATIGPLKLSAASPSPEFAARLDELASGAVLAGFAGRFVEEKGFDILLKAIPLVVEKVPNVKFVFAGEVNVFYEKFYEYNRELLEKNRDRVELLGLLDDNDLAYFYKKLSAFVISSRSDCFPLTQIEAAKTGVPCVVTDIPGARMLVKSSGFGQVVKPEDPAALAAGIAEVLLNRDKYLPYHQAAVDFLAKYERLDVD